MSDRHVEPPAVKRGDLEQALRVASALRNVIDVSVDGEGETPTIVEVGALPPEGDPRRANWDPTDWCYELHVADCPVVGTGGFHSEAFLEEPGGVCCWCGAVSPAEPAPAAPPATTRDIPLYFIGLAEEELRRAGLDASAERVRELERLLDPATSDKEPL